MREEELELEASGGGVIRALLVLPAPDRATEPVPGVVFAKTVSGLDIFQRELARQIVAGGFALIVPALGREGDDGPPPDRRAVADLETALAALSVRPDVDEDAIAAVGLGAGGTLAWLHGCQSRGIAAVVDWGGPLVYDSLDANRPSQPLELALNLSGPFLGVFHERNPSTPPEHVAAVREALSRSFRHFDIVCLPEAGPGFFDETRESHGAGVVLDTWRRVLAFLRETLIP